MSGALPERMVQRFEIGELYDAYAAALDNDRLEDWPGFFVEDCLYEIVPKENEDAGLPAPVMHCDNASMLRDRVLSLRHANIYEKPTYRHFMSGYQWASVDDATLDVTVSYIVVNTSQAGQTAIYQAGVSKDRIVRTDAGWRFKVKRVIYDTLRVQTLLATPI